MKRLSIAVGILLAVFAATLYNAHYLNTFTSGLSTLLTQAEERAEAGDWSGAAETTSQASEEWEARAMYLHIMLRHADTDDVNIGFREVEEFIQQKESGEYSAANARLIAEIGLLYEAEQLSLKNVL